MELNWFQCLLYGLISGLAEFLPVSAAAHQTLFMKLLGQDNDPLLQFSAHLGAIFAVVLACMPSLLRMRRERRLASVPKNRRRRQPDFGSLMEGKVLRMAAVSMAVLFLGWSLVKDLGQRFWILAILTALNGIWLYIPPYLPGANKTAQALSGLDAMLIGLAAGAGMIPGISRTGAAIGAAQLRGADRRYAVELALQLSIPALLILMVLELFTVVMGGAAVTGMIVFYCFIVAAASFTAAYFAVTLLRFMAVNVGFSGFAYYSWGFALVALILYLI